MINAYPQNNMYGNAWWGAIPPYGNTGMGGVPTTQQTVAVNAPPADGQFQTIDGVMWIQGEGAAKAYNVPAGKTVMLLDSESDRFYIKRADVYGRPQPLQVFKYSPDTTAEAVDTGDYVTRKEFDELKAALDALQAPQNAETKAGD